MRATRRFWRCAASRSTSSTRGPSDLQLNKEYALLASVIGTGVRGAFNIDKCRYSKIIVMTDADVDGGHIRALLLALFYQETPA